MASDPTVAFDLDTDIEPYVEVFNQAARKAAEALDALLGPVADELDPEHFTLDECDLWGLTRSGRDSDYCDHSFLRPSACAHCQGHVLDPDLEEASKQ